MIFISVVWKLQLLNNRLKKAPITDFIAPFDVGVFTFLVRQPLFLMPATNGG
jgi:hypothetical protein